MSNARQPKRLREAWDESKRLAALTSSTETFAMGDEARTDRRLLSLCLAHGMVFSWVFRTSRSENKAELFLRHGLGIAQKRVASSAKADGNLKEPDYQGAGCILFVSNF
jgi:hypothetical protein